MPRNSAVAPVIGIASGAATFGLVWHMWWLAIFGLIVIFAAVVARSFVRDTHRVIPASEVARIDESWREATARAQPVPREIETSPANQGLALVRS